MDREQMEAANLMMESREATQGGTVKQIDFDLIDANPERNVRTPATLQLEKMAASIRKNGYKKNHPIVVVQRGKGQGATYDVLCGFRRMGGLSLLTPEERAEALPKGKVPAVVHTGLTPQQEALILLDHSDDEDRVKLDEYGEFLAVKKLMLHEFNTQAGIAEKLGKTKLDKNDNVVPNRSWVQPRVNLAQLPGFVQEQFRILWTDGKDKTNVRIGDIAKLFKTYNECGMDETAEAFQTVWNEAMAPASESSKAKAISAKAMREKAGLCQSSAVKNVLLVAGGHNEGSLVDIDSAVAKAETAAQQLTRIADYLGAEAYAKLCKEANEAAETETVETETVETE